MHSGWFSYKAVWVQDKVWSNRGKKVFITAHWFSPVKKAELGEFLLDGKHRISITGTIFLFKSAYNHFNIYVKAEPDIGREGNKIIYKNKLSSNTPKSILYSIPAGGMTASTSSLLFSSFVKCFLTWIFLFGAGLCSVSKQQLYQRNILNSFSK